MLFENTRYADYSTDRYSVYYLTNEELLYNKNLYEFDVTKYDKYYKYYIQAKFVSDNVLIIATNKKVLEIKSKFNGELIDCEMQNSIYDFTKYKNINFKPNASHGILVSNGTAHFKKWYDLYNLSNVPFGFFKELTLKGLPRLHHIESIKLDCDLTISNCSNLKTINKIEVYGGSIRISECDNLRMIGSLQHKAKRLERLKINQIVSLDSLDLTTLNEIVSENKVYLRNINVPCKITANTVTLTNSDCLEVSCNRLFLHNSSVKTINADYYNFDTNSYFKNILTYSDIKSYDRILKSDLNQDGTFLRQLHKHVITHF